MRVKFIRGEEIKYISHLDIMRTFKRAIRRSHIPIGYSRGFNPQPQIVFGLPLAIGVTSEADYADFQFVEYIEPNDFTRRLNKELPPGLKVIEAKIKHNKDNIMAKIVAASYKIFVYSSLNLGINEVRQKVNAFKKMENIIVQKDSKKTAREIDIKPMIHKLKIDECIDKYIDKHIEEYAEEFIISALLSAGGTVNLKPEMLVTALNMYTVTDFRIIHIHRTGLFIKKGEEIIDPLDSQALEY
ncbi:MAG: DUF2344 domain-containing protein [Firmicutes bacterium]|nr:DUF2344 domain-containing protein [Bacillota bacterium]